MEKKNKLIMIAVIAITVLMVGCIIVTGIIRNGSQNDSDEQQPDRITDASEPADPAISEIPTEPEDEKDTDPAQKPGDVRIDVGQPVDGSRDDKPGIDGDVAIIPGVKGEDE